MRLLIATLLLISLSAWKMEKKIRIIFFGDSITQAGVQEGGYIWRMQQAINSSKQEDNFELIGAGIGGNKVYDLYLRMEQDVLEKNPDVVLIYVGVNDVWHKATSGTGTDKDKFGQFYTALIKKMQARNIKVVLVTPAGIGELKDLANKQDADLNAYSDVIRGLAKTYNCPLVDLRSIWLDFQQKNNTANTASGILSTDGVHLNATGNQLVCDEMMKVLGIKK